MCEKCIMQIEGGDNVKISAVKLFAICADRKLTLTDLKKAAGVSYGTLQNIRNGKPVNISTIGKIAAALKIKSCEILEV